MTSGNDAGAAIHTSYSFGYRIGSAAVHYIKARTCSSACTGSVTNPTG